MLGGIIASALGGAGQAMGQIADEQIKQNQRVDLMRVQQEIDDQKAMREQELKKDLLNFQVTGPYAEARRNSLAADETAVGTARSDVAVGQARKMIGVKVQEEKEVGGARAENAGKEATARLGAETDALFARWKNPEYFKGLSAEARAKHIESQASIAQAALTRLQMEGVQDTQRLQRALADARRGGNDEAVQKIQQEITDRAFTGKDTSKAYTAYAAASTKLIDLQAKLEDPAKMLDPAQKAQLNSEIAETRAVLSTAMKDLGVKVPESKTVSPEQQAQADARTAVATGKISLEDANKRLAAANFKPIEGATPAAKTPASTKSTASPATAQSEPPDSPSAQWKARQAKIKADKEAWDAAQSESAQKLFGQTNFKDVQAVQALQDSPLFSYLTPQQKAQVQNAVLGRSR